MKRSILVGVLAMLAAPPCAKAQDAVDGVMQVFTVAADGSGLVQVTGLVE